jgi:phospholipase C
MIVMQENRSFDHYFGTMRGVRGFGDRSTITLPGGLSVFEQPTSAPGQPVTATQFPWHLSEAPPSAYQAGHQPPSADLGVQGYIGTPHTWDDQHGAWQGGWLNGWIAAKAGPTTMGYLTRSDIPFHYALADAYTVGDAYHSSVLSATGPNRTYLWSGTIDAQKSYSRFTAYDGGDERGKNLLWESYAETLQRAGVTWRVYQCVDHFHNNGLEFFRNFAILDHTQNGTAAPGNVLYDRGVATVPEPSKGLTANPENLAAAIKQDVLAGTLPEVSWVVSNQLFSEHPDAAPTNGGLLVRSILDALNADPDTLNSTLVILTYDENDGQFDHVPPPAAPRGEVDEWVKEKFGTGTLPLFGATGAVPVGLGFRVPLILISPWTRGGFVTSEVFDHTSIIRFIERWTAAIGRPARCPNISSWRRRACGDLTRALDFTTPVYGLPELPATTAVISDPEGGGYRPTPVSNAMPTQEPGAKLARPLPYQPNANLLDVTIGGSETVHAELAFSNNGPQAASAAHFAVYNNAAAAPSFVDYPKNAPSQHTIDPARRKANQSRKVRLNLGDSVSPGVYDLTVIGPNRFLRHFRGSALDGDTTSQARAEYYPAGLRYPAVLALYLTNHSHHAVTFRISANRYAPGSRAVKVRVPARSERRRTLDPLATTLGWYDVTITRLGDPLWLRRFVGHLENGRTSVTGS